MSSRLLLFDADRKLVAGPPETAERAELRPIVRDGAVVGYLGCGAAAGADRVARARDRRAAALAVRGDRARHARSRRSLLGAGLAHWLTRRVRAHRARRRGADARRLHGAGAGRGRRRARAPRARLQRARHDARRHAARAQPVDRRHRARAAHAARGAARGDRGAAGRRAAARPGEPRLARAGGRPPRPPGRRPPHPLARGRGRAHLSQGAARPRRARRRGDRDAAARARPEGASRSSCTSSAARRCSPTRRASRRCSANLLQNTLRYTDAPGKVAVAVRREGDRVVLDWQDSQPRRAGSGPAAAHRAPVPRGRVAQPRRRRLRASGSRS